MNHKIELSIIIPVLNEQDNLLELVQRLLNIIRAELNIKYEIIIIDDGSKDETWLNIQTLNNENNNIKGISFSRNFGHQYALAAGINNVKGEVVFILDGDMQHPPELLKEFYNKMKEGYDIVAGVREEDKELSFLKRSFSKFYYWFFNKISEVQIVPGTSDFRLISNKVVKFLRSLPENDKFYRALLPWSGFNTYYYNYKPNKRKSGIPKYNFAKSFIMGFRGIISFSSKPLYLSVYLGFIIATLAFLYGIYALYVKLILHAVPPGFTDVIASILFLSGLQLMVLGIIGIYIGKLKVQVIKRPDYLINKTCGLKIVENEVTEYEKDTIN